MRLVRIEEIIGQSLQLTISDSRVLWGSGFGQFARCLRRAADIAVLVTTRNFRADNLPKFLGIRHVAASCMPCNAGMLSGQRGKACGGQPATLVTGFRVRFFDPPRPAVPADLVIGTEYRLAV